MTVVFALVGIVFGIAAGVRLRRALLDPCRRQADLAGPADRDYRL